MSDWPVGLSTGCFYQKPILECLRPVCEGGFSMIEICSFPAHLDYHNQDAVNKAAARVAELGMEAYSFHAPFADHIDITALNADHREAAFRDIERAAEAAATLQARYFVIHAGPEHAGRPPCEEHMRRMDNAVGMLNRLARRCGELGLSFVLENKLTHLLLGTTPEILWIIGAMDSTHVGVCLDTGHAHLSGDLYGVMHKLSAHLRMVHVNDNHGHRDDHLPPPQGGINWRRLMSELAETGFHGGLILELGGGREISDILADARRARCYLRDLSRELALASPPTMLVPRPLSFEE